MFKYLKSLIKKKPVVTYKYTPSDYGQYIHVYYDTMQQSIHNITVLIRTLEDTNANIAILKNEIKTVTSSTWISCDNEIDTSIVQRYVYVSKKLHTFSKHKEYAKLRRLIQEIDSVLALLKKEKT